MVNRVINGSIGSVLFFLVVLSVQAATCDVDADGDIDRTDIALIQGSRGARVLPGDPRDADGNGIINVLDARKCALACRRESCLRNSPPVANAGQGQTRSVGEIVTLDGSASVDPDGDALSYRWQLVRVPPGSAAVLSDPAAVRPTFLIDVRGRYVARLIVNDGRLDSAGARVRINSNNTRPVANAGPDQTLRLGQPVTLDAGGSTDADGDLLAYRWSLVRTPPGSATTLSDAAAVRLTFTPDVVGDYELELVVNDGRIDSLPDTVLITTRNLPPIADAGPDQSAAIGDRVTLDGSRSTDPDGDTLSYRWSFSARPPDSAASLSDPAAPNPSFVVDRRGDYVLQLIVNDGVQDSPADTVVVSSQNRPIANAGVDRIIPVGETVSLNGAASSDADGDPLTYRWSLIARPPGSRASLSNPGSVTPILVADAPGNYVAQLIVNDGTLDSLPDTVVVTAGRRPVAVVAAVNPVNQSRIIKSTISVYCEADSVLLLDGTTSTLGSGSGPLSFRWALIPRLSGSQATLSNPRSGVATLNMDGGINVVQLVVDDGLLSSQPTTVTVEYDCGCYPSCDIF